LDSGEFLDVLLDDPNALTIVITRDVVFEVHDGLLSD
jgi:hypothetical protein